MSAVLNVQIEEPAPVVGLAELEEQAERCATVVQDIRQRILAPTTKKVPPELPSPLVAQLCGINITQLNNRQVKGDLPPGTSSGQGRKRTFTVAEAQTWVRAYGVAPRRPKGAPGCVITTANFKGGSTKTTTTMTLAQGLSLRGYRVLCIDLDPQGSLTTLFGLLPDIEVEEQHTVAPFFFGEQQGLRYAALETYWPNVDLIPAATSLFALEFSLPAKQMKDPSFRFWDQLNQGLQDIRQDYDVILLDTPPSLSYLTINSLMAADGLLIPLPPNALDFASSAQFWRLFSDLTGTFKKHGENKMFSFVHVLMTRVDNQDSVVPALRRWIQATYREKVLQVEIPKTAVTSAAAAEFGTVYDISRYTGHAKTYQRAREAYDACVLEIERSVSRYWRTPAKAETAAAENRAVA